MRGAYPPTFTHAQLLWSCRKQAGFFNLTAQPRRAGPSHHDGAQAVVTLGPVTAARASPGMIPKPVSDPIAQRAIAVSTCNGNTKAQSEEDSEKGRFQVEAKSG